MGTPNVNREFLVKQLSAILSQPAYKQLIERGNEYAEMAKHNTDLRKSIKNSAYRPTAFVAKGPAEVAEDAVETAFGKENKPNLLEPVIVMELIPRGQPIRLYRAYDGISSKTALTVGRWWCNRRLMKEICHAAEKVSGKTREENILQYMCSAMFVHPERNYAKEVARMEIPEGGRLPAIVGKGSWEALKPDPDKAARKEAITIQSEEDVIEKLAMVPIPGPKQFFTPLFNDMWICQVPKGSPRWPID